MEALVVIDPDVGTWINTKYQFSPATARTSQLVFNNWYEWLQEHGSPQLVGLSAGQLADYQEKANKATARLERTAQYQILNSVLEYIKNHPEWRTGYRVKVHQSVKSFFDSWGTSMPKLEKASKGCLKGVMNLKVRKLLTNEIANEVIAKCDPAHKAVYSMMVVSGMGLAEICYWSNQGGPHERIKVNGVELMEITLRARKGNLDDEFITYVGGTALEYYDLWMKVRAEKHPDAKTIFVSKQGRPMEPELLSLFWVKKLKTTGRYAPVAGQGHQRSGMNAHQLRSLFRTNWTESGAKTEVAEYCLGHKTDPLNYDQYCANREHRVAAYLKALPYLNIFAMRKPDAEVLKLKERMGDVEKQNDLLKTILKKLLVRQTGQDTLTKEEKEALGLSNIESSG
jgi:site-specific recombinase XerC